MVRIMKVLAIFLLIPLLSSGQKSEKHFLEYNKIGITPSALLNEFKSIQLNTAWGISNKMDLNSEWGYIFKDDRDNSSTGIRIRIEPRFRLSNKESKSFIYWSLLAQYRRSNTKMTHNNTKSIFSSGSDLFTYNEIYSLFGVGAKLGGIIKISDNIYCNIGAGLGVNFANMEHRGKPENKNVSLNLGELLVSPLYFSRRINEGPSIEPLMIFHVGFSYILK